MPKRRLAAEDFLVLCQGKPDGSVEVTITTTCLRKLDPHGVNCLRRKLVKAGLCPAREIKKPMKVKKHGRVLFTFPLPASIAQTDASRTVWTCIAEAVPHLIVTTETAKRRSADHKSGCVRAFAPTRGRPVYVVA